MTYKNDEEFNFEKRDALDAVMEFILMDATSQKKEIDGVYFNENHGDNEMAGTQDEWDKASQNVWDNIDNGIDDSLVMVDGTKELLPVTTASQDLMDEIINDMTMLSAKMELLIDMVNSK